MTGLSQSQCKLAKISKMLCSVYICSFTRKGIQYFAASQLEKNGVSESDYYRTELGKLRTFDSKVLKHKFVFVYQMRLLQKSTLNELPSTESHMTILHVSLKTLHFLVMFISNVMYITITAIGNYIKVNILENQTGINSTKKLITG